MNAHIRDVVDRYAALGYRAVAPALFDRLERGVELGYTEETVTQGRAMRGAIDWDDTVRDVGAAVTHLASNGPVGVHEEAVWILLETLGLIEEGSAPGPGDLKARLARRAEGLPSVLDVRYRHVVSEEDEFRMHPGFRNFDVVDAGQELGADRAGPVRTAFAGRVFLPLYQRQGDDGFFIVRQRAPVWLKVSRVLRTAGADRVAPWLPGVRPHPARSDAVVLARWARNRGVIGLLHLMGFTVRGESGGAVMVRRQEGPARQPESAPTGG